MAAPTAALGGDLPPKERLAFEEGHDADVANGQLEKPTATDAPSTSRTENSDKGSTYSDDSKTNDLEKGHPEIVAAVGETELERDPNIVDWDGPDDPENPLNWTARKKWLNILMISLFTFLAPLASSMFAPGVPQVLEDLNTKNQSLATFVVSVFLLGFAMGPLVIAPACELYGRLYIYHISNVLFVIFTAACGLSTNMGMLIGFRFLAGCVGVTPVNNGGGTIADITKPEDRGKAMSIWAMGPLLGPVIGPIAGGYLAQAKGWRWIFWLLTILTGVSTIAAFFTMSETYAPTLLERKAKRLRKETGNPNLRSKLDTQTPPKQMFKLAIVRPIKLLFLSPICGAMCIYMSFVYSLLYLLFTTFTFVFQENYHFSSGTVGLVFIGIGIGMMIGLVAIGATSDPIMKYLANKHNDGKLKPEYRLPIIMFAGPTLPIGLILYGWTAQYHVQWAVPLLGTLFVGVGLISAFMSINTYLVDTFQRYAASAMAANTILRSLFGATFPLFGLQMYATLGLGWGNSLLGFIALAMCPIPWLFYWYGERLRTNPKFQVKF